MPFPTKKIVQHGTAVILSAAMFSSCTMTPGENAAVYGGLAGAGAGLIGSAAGLSGTESLALGLGVGALTAVTVYVVAKHEATKKQREIAEQRAQTVWAKMPETKRATMKQSKKRYIAVDTVQESNNKGAKSVMIFDTQQQKIVGNKVYDVEKAPKVGSTAKFDTYSAEYVGKGA